MFVGYYFNNYEKNIILAYYQYRIRDDFTLIELLIILMVILMFGLTVLLLFLPVKEALKLMVIPGERFLKKGKCIVKNKLVKFTRHYNKPNQRS